MHCYQFYYLKFNLSLKLPQHDTYGNFANFQFHFYFHTCFYKIVLKPMLGISEKIQI